MLTTRRTLLGGSAAGIAVLAMGCARQASAELASVLDRLTTQVLHESPETCTGLGVSEQQAGGRFVDRLTDPSREALARFRGILQENLASLRAINRNSLADADKVTLDVVSTSLDDNIADIAFEPSARFPYQVTQLSGTYVNIPDFLASQHPITSREEVDAYFSRMQAFAHALDTDSALIEADAGRGVVAPDYAIDRMIGQQRQFAATAPRENVLVASLATRLAQVSDIPEADRAGYVARAETLLRDEVLPAYQRQIAALQGVRARASHDAGVWKLPHGEELYATALKVQTTTSMTPDEVHQMGLDLVARHNGEMDAILRAQGMTRGSVAERVRAIGVRPDQIYPNTDAGRAQCLADLNHIVQTTSSRMPEFFNTLAGAELEIKRIPPYTEAGSSGGYYQQGALDGSRPGAYYINLRDMREIPKFGLPTLTYHEGVPGHHWQLSIQQEAENIPFFRSALSFFGAYIEGWALYSEQLMDEAGAYSDNPINRLGYLQSAAFRASRLVVDTGMHSKRWTREQAIQSMSEATGDTLGSIESEVERYSVWPAQACCYMVGKQAILRARASAQAAMGERFDLKGFHDIVLTNGATPLSVTAQLVEAWSRA